MGIPDGAEEGVAVGNSVGDTVDSTVVVVYVVVVVVGSVVVLGANIIASLYRRDLSFSLLLFLVLLPGVVSTNFFAVLLLADFLILLLSVFLLERRLVSGLCCDFVCSSSLDLIVTCELFFFLDLLVSAAKRFGDEAVGLNVVAVLVANVFASLYRRDCSCSLLLFLFPMLVGSLVLVLPARLLSVFFFGRRLALRLYLLASASLSISTFKILATEPTCIGPAGFAAFAMVAFSVRTFCSVAGCRRKKLCAHRVAFVE